MFVAPNLAAVVVFMLFPLGFSLYMSFQKWDLFTHATFVRLDNFRNLFTSDPLFLIAVVNTAVLHRRHRGTDRYRQPRRRRLSKPENQRHQPLSDGRLLAVGDFLGGDGGRLAVRLQHRQWPTQHHARLAGNRPHPMANRTPMGHGLALPGQRLAQCALRHGRPAGRDAGGSGDCVRGGQDRWCRRDSPVRVHHGTADPGALSFVVVISIIHAFQAFDLVYVLTGANGGPETATYVLGIMLFQHAFSFLEFGYASALAWVMFAILLVLTVLQLRITHRRSWEASRGLG